MHHTAYLYGTAFLMLLLALCTISITGVPAGAAERMFTHFSADLPEGWDGQERTAFSTGSEDEYMLVLGKQDLEAERFLAQISLYLLPNTQNAVAQDFAEKMAERQGDTSPVTQEGHFWVFRGNPRNETVKGEATTMVATTPARILIIIAQDPENHGADRIVTSLKGLTNMAKDALGR